MDEKVPCKRQREEEIIVEEEVIKRQKSYKDILTLLDEEEDESYEDLSSLISTLQEEISYEPGLDKPGSYEIDPDNQQSSSTVGSSGSGGEEEEGERVMRHLLEASDDELGIPNMELEGFDVVVEGQVDGGDLSTLPFGDGNLWEFEDHEAVNYYNHMFQSEIFL